MESKNQVAELKGRLEDEEADLEASIMNCDRKKAALQTLVDEQKKDGSRFLMHSLHLLRKKAASYKRRLEDQTAQIKSWRKRLLKRRKKRKKKQERNRNRKENNSDRQTRHRR